MNETLRILLIVCPMVFLAGVIDAVAGGGGLISLPAYLAAGLPPHLATATNKCSSTFGTLVSTIRFMKGQKVHYLSAICAAIAALMGSPIGAYLNLSIDEKYLMWVLVIALPIIAFVIVTKKDLGAESKVEQLSKKQVIYLSLGIGFVIGMYDGFLGPGTGTFLILAYTILVKFDVLTASGNAKVVNLASNVGAFITFAVNGNIIWQIGIIAAFFGIAGNLLGSELAIRNGKEIIRPMFFVVLTLLLVKIIYDLLT